MLPNADSLSQLCAEDKHRLLDYISNNLKMINTINKKYTAYGLKAGFNRITEGNKKHHITSQCFMEAMVECGFKAQLVPDASEPNWYFNVGKVHFTG